MPPKQRTRLFNLRAYYLRIPLHPSLKPTSPPHPVHPLPLKIRRHHRPTTKPYRRPLIRPSIETSLLPLRPSSRPSNPISRSTRVIPITSHPRLSTSRSMHVVHRFCCRTDAGRESTETRCTHLQCRDRRMGWLGLCGCCAANAE